VELYYSRQSSSALSFNRIISGVIFFGVNQKLLVPLHSIGFSDFSDITLFIQSRFLLDNGPHLLAFRIALLMAVLALTVSELQKRRP